MQQKISFNTIIDGLVAINGCSHNTAESFLRELFLLIPELIQQNKAVTVKGIGSFIKDSNDNESIKYEPDKSLIEVLNQPFSCFEPIELDELVSDDILNEEFISENDVTEIPNLSENTNEKNANEDIYESILMQNEFDCNKHIEIVNSEKLCNDKITDQKINSEKTSDMNNSQLNKEIPDEEKTTISKPIIYIGIFIIGLIIGFLMGYIIKDVAMNNKLDKYIQSQIQVNSESKPTKLYDVTDSINDIKLEQEYSNNVQPIDEHTDSTITDKITKNRFLTTMAREHYGNLNFWVYIYEENISNLGHPDKITPGTIVVIPPKSKYNIDPLNEDAINIAKLKSKEIYNKFRKKD